MKPYSILPVFICFFVFFFASCSKHNESAPPPATSNNITVTIAFPDGRSLTATDYGVQVGPTPGYYQIDGTALDTTTPVAWLNTNNLAWGWEMYTYGASGYHPGTTYRLVFSTPTYFDNAAIAEVYNWYRYDASFAWALGSVSVFEYEGSTYDITKLSVTTTVKDSTSATLSGSFSVTLYADSIFTVSSRTAYAYSDQPIQITGMYNNITLP